MKSPDVKGQFALSAFLRSLVRWCDLSTCSASQRGAASELFATLVNKYVDGVCHSDLSASYLGVTCRGDVSDFLDEMLTSYYPTTLNNPRVPAEARRMAIDNWVWVRLYLHRQGVSVY